MSIYPKRQVILILASSVLAGFSVASILNFSDPESAGILTFIFLYLSLFLFSLGLLTLIGLGLRQKLWPALYVVNLRSSFRQGILISIFILSSFWLLSEGILFWWVAASLLTFFIFIEAFFNLKI